MGAQDGHLNFHTAPELCEMIACVAVFYYLTPNAWAATRRLQRVGPHFRKMDAVVQGV